MGVPATSDDPQSLSIYPFLYANPLSRGLQFCAGMATWVLWDSYLRHKSLSFAAWTMIEVAAIVVLGVWVRVYPAGIAYIPAEFAMWANISACTVPFAILIAVIASGRGLLGNLLKLRAFVWLGEISYAIYLLHWVLMKIFAHQLPQSYSTPWLFFGTLFALSALSHGLIEVPAKIAALRTYGRITNRFSGRSDSALCYGLEAPIPSPAQSVVDVAPAASATARPA